MACQKHQKDFVANCSGCLKPLCPECVSIERDKRVYCFQCATALSIKEGAQRREEETLAEEKKQEKAAQKKGRGKKILLYLALAVLLLEVGIIIAGRFFGHRAGDTPPPAVTVEQQQRYDYAACVANLAGLNSAVKIYKRQSQGAAPATLADLTPKYFKTEPRCPVTGKSYSFSTANGSHKIFCPNPEVHAKKSLYIESQLGLMTEEL